MSIQFRCSVDILTPEQMLQRRGLEKGGQAQKAIDMLVIKYSLPYCPFDTGVLANSPFSASTPGCVTYPGPYAHYQYYGEVYGPNIPVFDDDSGVPTRWFSPPGQKKHPTGRDLTYKTDQNPNAGPFWVERMKADRIKDIEKEVRKFARLD